MSWSLCESLTLRYKSVVACCSNYLADGVRYLARLLRPGKDGTVVGILDDDQAAVGRQRQIRPGVAFDELRQLLRRKSMIGDLHDERQVAESVHRQGRLADRPRGDGLIGRGLHVLIAGHEGRDFGLLLRRIVL